jgi:hypothetical protein
VRQPLGRPILPSSRSWTILLGPARSGDVFPSPPGISAHPAALSGAHTDFASCAGCADADNTPVLAAAGRGNGPPRPAFSILTHRTISPRPPHQAMLDLGCIGYEKGFYLHPIVSVLN